MLLREKLTYHKFELIDAIEYCMEHFEHQNDKIREYAYTLYNQYYNELQEVQQRLEEL